MTTKTTTPKAPKTPKAPPVLYPFKTKAQIAGELAGSFEARCQAIVTIWRCQTQHEQERKVTEVKNRVGFMSSHAVNGSRVAEKLVSGAALDEKDAALVDAIAPRYCRQLAVLAREEAIAANPELAATTACFFQNNG